MPRYQEKPVVVDAFRWTDTSGWPEWALVALSKGYNVNGMAYEPDSRYPGGPGLWITQPAGNDGEVARPGNWILRHADGRLSVCANRTFEYLYVKMEEEE